MACPPNGNNDTPIQLETTRPVAPGEPSFTHNDLHLSNVMVCNRGDGCSEHNLIPSIKFIDFGYSKALEPDEENMDPYQCAEIMLDLIEHSEIHVGKHVPYKGVTKTKAFEILPAPHGNGDAYPSLDPDLESAARTADAYNVKDNEAAETDEAMEQLMNKLLFEPPEMPQPSQSSKWKQS
ncbi:Uu.00g057520.m01.CDS01 [Anthostomella pinea]|uniref:Uu.00g057520.m01.CDS01 n=1 Tax=Anthostomella pinea TaxID=933095 RepID=A0AAI8VSV5_9PEZI|nr:Uu.00g057520.m01.CDS01 [Anthostomella pinea]